jgi:hypothetical protein
MIWASATTAGARRARQHARVQDLCPSTHRNAHIYVRVLHDACLQVGGEHKLAQRLGVDVKSIENWLAGIGRPPDEVFLRCLDLILEPG